MESKGKKIRDLAFTFFIITVVGIIAAAVIVATSDSLYYVFRVGKVMAAVTSTLAAVFLIIFAYFGYLFLSSYGEFVEDTREIKEILKKHLEGNALVKEKEEALHAEELPGVTDEEFEALKSDENIMKMLKEITEE